jgi:HK97 family phage portal protein
MRKRTREKIVTELLTQYKGSRTLQINEFGKLLQEATLDDSGDKTVSDMYRNHDWANIAIHTIARNIARTEFQLFEGDTEITSGEWYDLFNHVNAYMSPSQLWEATSAWINCRGECIWMLERETAGIPKNIFVVDPENWFHTLNKKGTEITMWYYKPPDSEKKIPYRINEIVHFRAWNKWNQWRGMNPLIAQDENIEQDYHANVSNTKLVKNNSVPLGIISSEQVLNADQAEELVKRWEAAHKGSSKAHKVAVTGRGAKYERIGLMPSEMQYIEMRKWNRNSILARYGIPPILLGVKDDMTPLSGSDTKEQSKSFWHKKLMPDLKFIEDVLKSKFFPQYGVKLEGKFNTDNIDELQTDLKQKVEYAEKLWNIGFTANEINEKLELGFEDKPWRDSWWKQEMIEEIGDDYREVEENQPVPPAPPPNPFFQPQEESKKVPSWLVGFILTSENKWEGMIISYRAKLKTWLFEIRNWYLEEYTGELVERSKDVSTTYERFIMWAEATEKLKTITEVFYERALGQVAADLKVLYKRTGWDIEFTIEQIADNPTIQKMVQDRLFNTLPQISKNIDVRMAKLIDKAGLEGWTKDQLRDAIKGSYTDIGGQADTIARTELNVIKDGAKQQSYIDKGIEKQTWIHYGGGKEDRWFHITMDNMTVRIDEPFVSGLGNTLMYPHDPAAPAEEVVNCRCGTIPADKET